MVRSLATLFFLIICNGIVVCANSQAITISGKVVDASGAPIQGAIFRFYQGNNNYFGISDKRGIYSSIISTYNSLDSLNLHITHLSYADEKVSFPPSIQGSFIKNFILKAEYKILDEVLVKQDIYEKGDTTFIRADAFRKPTDNNVNDLLKNIPEMRVLPNGLITYQGKLIADVLVEGSNFSDNYTDITNNLGARQVEQVQVIKNYNEIAALRGFEEGGMALNLKLKNDNKLKLSARIEAGAGIAGKYMAKTSSILIQPIVRSLFLANVNNTGFNPYSQIPSGRSILENNKYKLDASAQGILYREPYFSQTESFTEDRLPNANKSRYAVLNNIIPISKRLSLSVNGALYRDHFIRSREVTVNFYDDPLLNYFDINREDHFPKKWKAGAELTFSDTSIYVRAGFNYFSNQFNNEKLVTNANTFSITQNSADIVRNYGLYLSKRLGRKVAADLFFQFKQNSPRQHLQVINKEPIIFWDRLVSERVQQYKAQNSDFTVEGNLYFKNSVIQKLSIGYKSYQLKPQSVLTAYSMAGVADSFKADPVLDRKDISLAAYKNWTKNKIKLELSGGVMYATILRGGMKNSKQGLFPLFNINAEYKVNPYTSFSVSTDARPPYFDEMNLLAAPYMADYRTISFYHPTAFFRNTFNGRLMFNSANRSRSRSLMVMGGPTFAKPLLMSSYKAYAPGLFLNESVSVNKIDHQSNMLYISYMSMLRKIIVGTRSSMSLFENKSYYAIDSVGLFRNLRVETVFKKSISDWLIAEAGGVLSINKLARSGNANILYYPILRAGSNLHKRIDYDLIYRPKFSRSEGLSSSFHSLDAQLIYQPKNKKISFSLDAYNILNKRFFQTTGAYVFYSMVNRESVLPRYILLRMAFSIL